MDAFLSIFRDFPHSVMSVLTILVIFSLIHFSRKQLALSRALNCPETITGHRNYILNAIFT